MKITRFEDVLSWQKAKLLSLNVYDAFITCKDFGFRDQIQRASISVMNNVAEGFERNSDKELKQFLYIAKGSCGEVRSLLYMARDLHYINQANFDNLYSLCIEISKLLGGFIKKL